MSTKMMAPHLIERDGEKVCSACGVAFKADGDVSISRAFAAHVRQDHRRTAANLPQPGQSTPKTRA